MAIEETGQAPQLASRETEMAVQVVENLTTRVDPRAYHDEYREQVLGVIGKGGGPRVRSSAR